MEPTNQPAGIFNGTLLLLLSVGIAIYFVLTRSFNVYQTTATGIIAEVLWLPMLLLLVAIPAVILYAKLRRKLPLGKMHLYSVLLIIATVVYLLTVAPVKG